MQNVNLIGYLGRDAQIQTPSNGQKQFVSFSLAVTERAWVDKETGEEKRPEGTRWWNVTTNQVSLAPFLKKGTQVFVSGDFGFKVYKDNDNKGKPDFQCRAQRIELLSSSKSDKKDVQEEIELEA